MPGVELDSNASSFRFFQPAVTKIFCLSCLNRIVRSFEMTNIRRKISSDSRGRKYHLLRLFPNNRRSSPRHDVETLILPAVRDSSRVAPVVIPAHGEGTATAGAAGVESCAGGVVDAQGDHVGLRGEGLAWHRCCAGCCDGGWGEDGVEPVAVEGGVEAYAPGCYCWGCVWCCGEITRCGVEALN